MSQRLASADAGRMHQDLLLTAGSSGATPVHAYARAVGSLGEFLLTGDVDHLDSGVAAAAESVATTGSHDPDRSQRLCLLGRLLIHRFGRSGRPRDLGEAIRCTRAALVATAVADPERPQRLVQLDAALRLRWESTR